MHAHVIDTVKCPACGYVANRAANAGSERTSPDPGDMMVCGGCTHILMFNANMDLMEPTPEDMEGLDEDYMALIRQAQEVVRKVRGEIAEKRGN